jgi:hypothetical protein
MLTLSAKLVTLVAFSLFSLLGVDRYEIYLNNKLILNQSLEKPVALQDLKLTDANSGDILTIRYMQCTAPDQMGKSRSLALKDATGKIVKEWKFKDASEGRTEMTIPVKELLQAQKSSGDEVVLYYFADDRRSGQALAGL